MSIQTVADRSIAKKAGIAILATLLISAFLIIIKEAIAEENKDSTVKSYYIANVNGRIVVNDKGEVIVATIDIKNNCKSNLRIVKISNNGELAKLINGQISFLGAILLGRSRTHIWKPHIRRIEPFLLTKLKNASGEIIEKIDVEVERDINSMNYATDGNIKACACFINNMNGLRHF